jgi:hydroxyethylthiazole kinase-like uncharacterized protein yjeF
VTVTYTAAQIRAAETYHLARTPHGVLMRRAARAVADTVLGQLPAPIPGRRVALLVGAGNNGGDALVAGAYLRGRGAEVTAILAAPQRAHTEGLAALRRAGGRVLGADSQRVAAVLDRAEAIVDGLVGLGAAPPLRDPADRLVIAANGADGWRIAVDLPSGIDANTGQAVGPAFAADITVTIGAGKTGLLFAACAGRIRVADIDMDPARCDPAVPGDAEVLDDADAERLLPWPGPTDNKYSLGVTGVVAGSARYPGAALLAVGGAVAARPGLVRYAGPCGGAVTARWPEVVAGDDIPSLGRVNAWAVGPGMGLDAAALGRLLAVLATDVPVLVDADGLTLLARDPLLMVERAARSAPTVLTPHEGEFARLFPDLDPAGPDGRVAVVRRAAARCGATVLLKGHRTVVADPTGHVAVNTVSSPFLATAGSGDVLSGVAATMLSAGLDSVRAVALAAYLHGRAGLRAAEARRSGASALIDLLH